jgi:hypothetical protein
MITKESLRNISRVLGQRNSKPSDPEMNSGEINILPVSRRSKKKNKKNQKRPN